MNASLAYLVRHGAAVLFVAVFVEQMGVPLPAAPWLLAAGALAASGEINPIILDLRSQAELQRDPSLIRGARHMTMEELKLRQHEIPRDRDIILYCSCPNEVSSARMALLLHRNGILRVRPLLGGIDAWRERNYPTEPRAVGERSLPGADSADEVPKTP